MIDPKKEFMEASIKEAIEAKEKGDYAIGAVVVKDGKIIAKGANGIKVYKDSSLNAEMVAIRNAHKALNNRYLEDCILYTTHEPCPMCASAAILAKMKGIVFGASMEDMKKYATENGNDNFTWRIIDISCSDVLQKGDPKLELVEGFMKEECKALFHSD